MFGFGLKWIKIGIDFLALNEYIEFNFESLTSNRFPLFRCREARLKAATAPQLLWCTKAQ